MDGPKENKILISLEGTTLADRYRIEKLLAEGGIGVVYIGTHLSLDRQIAIKILRPTYFSLQVFRKRFEREAKVLSKLSHINIVTVTDYGISEEKPFLVMELLNGKSLDEEVKKAPFTIKRSLHITKQILAALSYAHNESIVHRDLKPSNIFLLNQPGVDDLVKILDFGLAKFLTDEINITKDTLTQQGTVFGTPAYMSPEQSAGGVIDFRSDLYSCGLLLYEMITGKRPFNSDNQLELLRMHLFTPPTLPSKIVPDLNIPAALDNIIIKALAKIPDNRYRSADDFLETILEFEDDYHENLKKDTSVTLNNISEKKNKFEPFAEEKKASINIDNTIPAVITPMEIKIPDSSEENIFDSTIKEKLNEQEKVNSQEITKQKDVEKYLNSKDVSDIKENDINKEKENELKKTSLQIKKSKIRKKFKNKKLILITVPILVLIVISIVLVSIFNNDKVNDNNSTGHNKTKKVNAVEKNKIKTEVIQVTSKENLQKKTKQDQKIEKTDPLPPPINPFEKSLPNSLEKLSHLLKRKNWSRQTNRYRYKMVSAYQDDPRVYLIIGHAFFQKAWYKDALNFYKKALKLDPSVRGDPKLRPNLEKIQNTNDNNLKNESSQLLQMYYKNQ